MTKQASGKPKATTDGNATAEVGRLKRARGKTNPAASLDRWKYRQGSQAAAINDRIEDQPVTAKGLALASGVSNVNRVRSHLKSLVENGFIVRCARGVYIAVDAGAKKTAAKPGGKSRGAAGQPKVQLRDELPAGLTFSEGRVQQRIVKQYKRSRKARNACIDAHPPVCANCKFDFRKVYGVSASEVKTCLHVHHLRPLNKVGKEYKVDPVKDLRPVCPNCHAVLHLGNEVRSIADISQRLARGKDV